MDRSTKLVISFIISKSKDFILITKGCLICHINLNKYMLKKGYPKITLI